MSRASRWDPGCLIGERRLFISPRLPIRKAPLTLTMLSAVTPPPRRGAVLGAWGGIGGLGAAHGPLVGGVLTGSVGWRAIFGLNVPLAAAFGVAVLGLVFAGHGGYASRGAFVRGFVPAMWLAAGLAAVGGLAAAALPRAAWRAPRRRSGLTDPLPPVGE